MTYMSIWTRRVISAALTLIALGGIASAQDNWRQEWEKTPEWKKTFEAAKVEGTVVIGMAPRVDQRNFLLKQWKEDFPEIELSLSIINSSKFVPATIAERQAGKYLWDIWNSGPNRNLVNSKLVDPMEPELILPETKDPAIWGGWDNVFYDSERKYVLALVNDLESPYYNAKVISPDVAKAQGLKLLLDPAYKGKIVFFDPRVSGPGEPYLPFFRDILGEDGLKKLVVDQEPVFVSSLNDAAQAIVRGKAVIAIAGRPQSDLAPFVQAGLKLDVRQIGNTPETAYLGTAGSTVAVFNNRPHPNAARVFVNWIASKRIGELLSKATGYDSRRRDVAPLDPSFAVIPGAKYVESQRPENEGHVLMEKVRHWRPE
jgi:iron(III) transport system substrate-binding protein